MRTLLQQYQTVARMARGLASLEGYRVPTIGTAAHNPLRWEYGGDWLAALNSGDPAGEAYARVARRLQPPGALLEALTPAARQSIERAYATVEITDSVAQLGGHQVAALRGYAGRLQTAIDAFERDVVSMLPGYHETTAVLDKIAGGQLIARRQDTAINQLLSHPRAASGASKAPARYRGRRHEHAAPLVARRPPRPGKCHQ